jgi:hypothetical protein
LGKPGRDFAGIQEDDGSRDSANVNRVEKNEVIEAFRRDAAQIPFRRGSGNDDIGRSIAPKFLGQSHAEAIVAVFHIPKAHQANPLLEATSQLFVKV